VATMHRTNGHWRAMNGSSGDGSDEKPQARSEWPSLVDCSILLKRSERRSGKAAQYRTSLGRDEFDLPLTPDLLRHRNQPTHIDGTDFEIFSREIEAI
jgi:hypothetical protein